MMLKTELNLAGKDWLTVEEAAAYCGVSLRQFKGNALAYGLQARRFMGRKLYAKADLYRAIDAAPLWDEPSIRGVARRPNLTASRIRRG